MTADEIVLLLRARHSADMFWTEVKDGPTWGGTHLRLDALAIPKSWSPVRLIGYEVKVSRSDWIQDQKFIEYRNLVHVLWIAAPKGVCSPDELPPGVGLIEPAGKRLRTVRKPIVSEIVPPWALLLYLLMSRSRCTDGPESREDRIRKRLALAEASKLYGFNLAVRTAARIDALENAARRNGDLEELDRWLAEHNADNWGSMRVRLDSALTHERKSIMQARRMLHASAKRVARMLSSSPATAPSPEP
jgi:hypothetical protein